MNDTYQKVFQWGVALCMISLLTACSSVSSMQGKLDAYMFPVKPGSDQWQQMTSRQEMLDAVQIPQDRLASISTAGLVATVLNYPLYMDMFVHNSLEQGIAAIKRDFNGLPALLARPDAGAALLQTYQETDAQAVDTLTDSVEQGNYVSALNYLEMILAQPEIGKRLSPTERRSLIKLALQQQAAKQQLTDIYRLAGGETTAFLVGRTLQSAQALQSNPEIEQFLQDDSYNGDAALRGISQSIFEQASLFLEQTKN